MTTSLVSEDALWHSLPHIRLLEKWLPLPDSDLAVIVKQTLPSATYWECYGGFLHTRTSFRAPAGLDVVSPSLPATWNFISLSVCSYSHSASPPPLQASCWLCFRSPCLALFSVHPFWMSSASSPASASFKHQWPPIISLNRSFLSSASFPLDNLPRVPWVSFPKYNL